MVDEHLDLRFELLGEKLVLHDLKCSHDGLEFLPTFVEAVSYTHLTLPTKA